MRGSSFASAGSGLRIGTTYKLRDVPIRPGMPSAPMKSTRAATFAVQCGSRGGTPRMDSAGFGERVYSAAKMAAVVDALLGCGGPAGGALGGWRRGVGQL